MEWQAIVVWLVVLGAVAYLGRRAYLGYKRPGCGDSCATCPGKHDRQGPDALVQIRPKKKKEGDDATEPD